MTISCGDTVKTSRILPLPPTKTFSITRIEEEEEITEENFSWLVYPQTPQGDFFRHCVNQKLIDPKGYWINPFEMSLPPISSACRERIHSLLSKQVTIHSKSLNRLPKKKQSLVLEAFTRIDSHCNRFHLVNPIVYDKNRNLLVYEVNVSPLEVYWSIYQNHSENIESFEMHGGGVPYLLQKEYYERAVKLLPFKQYPLEEVYETLSEKPSDYDLRIFSRNAGYDQIEYMFDSVLSLLADRLFYCGGKNENLKLILRETAFESVSHVITEDTHFYHFSIGNSKDLLFDFTLVDKLVNEQLFHSHGLSIDLQSLVHRSSTELPTPHGTVANGWKAIVDKLSHSITVDNVNYPYFKGWYRLVTAFAKGGWSPDLALEPAFRKQIHNTPEAQIYNDLIHVSSKHTVYSELTNISILFTACAFLEEQTTSNNHQILFEKIDVKSGELKPWLQLAIEGVHSGALLPNQVLDILQIVAVVQFLSKRQLTDTCEYYESSEGGTVTVQVAKNRHIVIPLNLKRALTRTQSLVEQKSKKGLKLIEAIVENFLSYISKDVDHLKTIVPHYRQELGDIAILLGNVNATSTLYISTWLNILGFERQGSIHKLSFKVMAILTEPISKAQKREIIREYSKLLSVKGYKPKMSHLWQLSTVIHRECTLQQAWKALLNDLIKKSHKENFHLIYELWLDTNNIFSDHDQNTIDNAMYQKAKSLDHELSVDILYSLITNQRYIEEKKVTYWANEIFKRIKVIPFEKTLKLTELLIQKNPRKNTKIYFNQKALIIFFKNLFQKGYYGKYVRLLLTCSQKKILCKKSWTIRIKLCRSMIEVVNSNSTPFGTVINLWSEIHQQNLAPYPYTESNYQKFIASTIKRAYEENFDQFGDHLLFNYAEAGNPLFSTILETRIDQIQPTEALHEVDRYSSHLSESQIIRYKLDALKRNLDGHHMNNCANLCLDLLDQYIEEIKDIDRFAKLLDSLLNQVSNTRGKIHENLTHQLLSHQFLYIYLPSKTIMNYMIRSINNSSNCDVTFKFYESIIYSFEFLSDNQQLYIAREFVKFLSTLDLKTINTSEFKRSLNQLINAKFSNLLNVLCMNSRNKTTLIFYNTLAQLKVCYEIRTEEYEAIFSSFISTKVLNYNHQLCLETCDTFEKDLLLPEFNKTPLCIDLLKVTFNLLLDYKKTQKIKTLYKKTLRFLSTIKEEKKADSLIELLKSVPLLALEQPDRSCSNQLLTELIHHPKISKDVLFNHLVKVYELIDIKNLESKIFVLSNISKCSQSESQQIRTADIFKKLPREVGERITTYTTEELIAFTKKILDENAGLWRPFIEASSSQLAKNEFNLFLDKFYRSIISDNLKGSESDILYCLQTLFTITKHAPKPFVINFLNTPKRLTERLLALPVESIEKIREDLIETLKTYLSKNDLSEQELSKLLQSRTTTLKPLLTKDDYTEISELDQQLIVWSCDALTPNIYAELCTLLDEIYQNSLLETLPPDRLADLFLQIPYLETLPQKKSERILNFSKILLSLLSPIYASNAETQLRFCLKIIDIHQPSLYEYAAQFALNILNIPEKPPKKLADVLSVLFSESHSAPTYECFSHNSLRESFLPKQYQQFVSLRICSQIKYALSIGDIEIQRSVFDQSLELLQELPTSSTTVQKAVSSIWDITIALFVHDPDFSYTLEEIHRKVCFIVIGQSFKTSVEKQFILQLWKYAKYEKNKNTLATKLFFEITTNLQTKLLNTPSNNLGVQQSVASFVHKNIEKFCLNHPEQKEEYLPIIDSYIDYSLTIADEALFDFCVRNLQNTYRASFVADFFESDDTTLHRCIYFTEQKDFITSPLTVKKRQNIIAKMIHHISAHPNHVNLRHGFTLLASIGQYLYANNPEKLFNLYQKLLHQLPPFLYEDVHYIFYNKNMKIASEGHLEGIRKILGSSPNLTVIKRELKKLGAKLDMVPLFETVRQGIMPGDIVQFSKWDNNTEKYAIDLIDSFFQILLTAYDQDLIPNSKPFDKYNTVWYLCDMLLKGLEFHGFVASPEKYYIFAQQLLPYILRLLDDPRLVNRDGLYHVYEKLLFQRAKGITTMREQLSAVHQWVMTLLQSKSPEKISRGKKLFLKAKKHKMYVPNSKELNEVLKNYPL